MPRFLLLILSAIISSVSSAFESSMITSLTVRMMLQTTATSFDNLYSESALTSTAVEYRSVQCKRATKDSYELNRLDLGALKIEEVQIQEASQLIRQIDKMQFLLCNEMVKEGRADAFAIMVGSERKKLLQFGKTVEAGLLGTKSASFFSDDLKRYKQELQNR